MAQADFSYAAVGDAAGLTARVSVFSDRPYLREQIGDDLRGAGFQIGHGGKVSALLDGNMTVLGDVVILDCPMVDASSMAALSRLDMRVARSGAQLIVSTSLDALDPVFSCFDQSAPQILVDASRVERVVAVGRILGAVSGARVRELSEVDRLGLLRLTEQVDAIASKFDRLDERGFSRAPSVAPSASDRDLENASEDRLATSPIARRGASVPLPDPRLVRRIIRQRNNRQRFFDAELFSDPAWDMLLDLTAAHAEHTRVSVSSLCIASGVPATTALRWIKQMTQTGLFDRIEDSHDKTRVFITLSDAAADAMAYYFAEAMHEPMAAAA
ncbi:MAG: MarR family transcriptional regulator [Erythrobacter sp.]